MKPVATMSRGWWMYHYNPKEPLPKKVKKHPGSKSTLPPKLLPTPNKSDRSRHRTEPVGKIEVLPNLLDCAVTATMFARLVSRGGNSWSNSGNIFRSNLLTLGHYNLGAEQ